MFVSGLCKSWKKYKPCTGIIVSPRMRDDRLVDRVVRLGGRGRVVHRRGQVAWLGSGGMVTGVRLRGWPVIHALTLLAFYFFKDLHDFSTAKTACNTAKIVKTAKIESNTAKSNSAAFE